MRGEARVGIEPTHTAFAEPRLTTWLPRLFDCERLTYAIVRRDAKQKFPQGVEVHPVPREVDRCILQVDVRPMVPEWMPFSSALGAWVILALKAMAAAGFLTLANVVILYAS